MRGEASSPIPGSEREKWWTKSVGGCRMGPMKWILPIIAGLVLPMCPAAQEKADTLYDLPDEETAAVLYTAAIVTLHNPNESRMEAIPDMLEACIRAGYAPACETLLNIREGWFHGLPQDKKKAADLALRLSKSEKKWRSKPAMHRACLSAMSRYARYCETGFGRERDLQEAYAWVSKAAELGYSHARVEQARYLMLGGGVKADPAAALKILQEVCLSDMKAPHLFNYMGCLYLTGVDGQGPDDDMALQCFRYGEHFGDADAVNNLGVMYEDGIGVEENTEQALRYYRRAAELGSKEASANLVRLTEEAAKGPLGTRTQQQIINGTTRVIEALPVSRHRKDRWLKHITPPPTE